MVKTRAARPSGSLVLALLVASLVCLATYADSAYSDSSLLQTQQSLVKMCRNFKQAMLKQQEELRNKYSFVHFPRQNIVRIPAICLRVLADETDFDPRRPLQYVNWRFDDSEIETAVSAIKNKIDDNKERLESIVTSRKNNLDNLKSVVRPHPPALDMFLNPNNLIDESNNSYQHKPAESIKLKRLHEIEERLKNNYELKNLMKSNRHRLSKYLSPIVLIPGLAGSRLQARLDKSHRVNFLCEKQTGWQEIWLPVSKLLPILVDCWLDNVRLLVDPVTGATQNVPGVESRVVDFGKVESVESLDVNAKDSTEYFAPIIEQYEALGYTRGRNLVAAPYDFRLAPNELQGWLRKLGALIEKTNYVSGSKKGATLVCHSMGCLNALIFLRKQTKEWRQRHVRKLIALASPWGGAIKAAKALVVGDAFDLPLVSEVKLRKIMRTFPAVTYLLPDTEVFEATNSRRALPGGPILVQTPSNQYKVADLAKLLRDLNLTRHADWHEKYQRLIRPLEPLDDVRVDCIHSLNIPTPEEIIFERDADFPDGEYELIEADGDGTVNAESLLVCERWQSMQPQLVKHIIIPNTNHQGVLSHNKTLTHIADDILGSSS